MCRGQQSSRTDLAAARAERDAAREELRDQALFSPSTEIAKEVEGSMLFSDRDAAEFRSRAGRMEFVGPRKETNEK